MKVLVLITSMYVLMAFAATVCLSIEESNNYKTSESERHNIVKRKARRGSGGRSSGSRSSSRSRSKSKPANLNPYPKQPAYNSKSKPANSNLYPKQPAYNPNYNAHQQQPYNNKYPVQQHGNGQHSGYGQSAHGQNNHVMGVQKSKTGMGGVLGGAAVGGLAGGALGAYGGYKLGRMVGSSGKQGHYGYFNSNHTYIRCKPPPKIEWDPVKNISYIPLGTDYDVRCLYYDKDPSKYSHLKQNYTIYLLNNTLGKQNNTTYQQNYTIYLLNNTIGKQNNTTYQQNYTTYLLNNKRYYVNSENVCFASTTLCTFGVFLALIINYRIC